MIFGIIAQVPSFKEKIRIQLWGDLDAYPEVAGEVQKQLDNPTNPVAEKNGIFAYPIQQVKKIAPFLINGMVSGWEFVYVPSDKARGVQEYFEITEILPADKLGSVIIFSDPYVEEENNRFDCWCEYTRNQREFENYKMWSSIKNPVISARGYGPVEAGIDGIKMAAEDALKTAIREHYRSKVKNKPKEITGKVLIRSEPLLGIDAGRYALNLDFFLEYGKIIEYTMY